MIITFEKPDIEDRETIEVAVPVVYTTFIELLAALCDKTPEQFVREQEASNV